jgi:hypothetical protein
MDGDTDGRSQNSRMAKKVLCFFFLCLLKYTQFVIFHVFAARRRRRRDVTAAARMRRDAF